jgi:alginate O-acetyltransferase complex protein AlgI
VEIYSFAFVLLVTVGLVLYYTVLRRCQWLCLLAISLVFFAASGWQGIFFLFFTALTVWGGGLWLARLDADCAARRKAPGITKDEKKLSRPRRSAAKKVLLRLCWSQIS